MAPMLWQHDGALVALAVVVCLFGSYTVCSLADRAMNRREKRWHLWMLGAGMATGSAIWSTHFIAMLALNRAIPMRFETWGTMVSVAVALLGSMLGLTVALARPGLRWRVTGGVIVSASIASMHFLGMKATIMSMTHTDDPLGVAASIAIGGALITAAVANHRGHDAGRRLATTGLVTLGVIVIHFGSMASMRMGAHTASIADQGHKMFAIALGCVICVLLLLAFAATSVANRIEAHDKTAAERLRSLANMSLEGILVVDAGGVIIDSNDQMCRLAGRNPVGMALASHLPEVCDAIRGGRAEMGAIETTLLRDGLAEMPLQVFVHRSQHVDQSTWTVVARDLTQQKEAEGRIRHAADHDSLTDLPNRALLMSRLERAMARSARTSSPAALLYIDLDGFKSVNDSRGHGRGDEVLKDIARILLQNVRDLDTVARLGGDEFVILQEDQTPIAAKTTAMRLIDAVAAVYGHGRSDVALGMSVGIAVTPNDAKDAGELIRLADVALYRAKADGKNQSRFFEKSMDRMAHEQRALEADLRNAVANGEIGIAYQPQMDAKKGEIVGFEALARWTHPRRGQIPPDVFIPIAERTGVIVELGAHILTEACRTAATWSRPLRIAVNLSPLQIRDPGLTRLIKRTLHGTGLAADRLELEITETAILRDERGTIAALKRMKALGLKIAMDDFGTGYSSLSSLQSFPFDKIKVDKSFVSAIESDGKAATIVKAVIGLGHNLGLPIVAEGVENENQLALLRAEGCTEIQGYLIGRPLEIAKWDHVVNPEARTKAA